MSGLLFLIILGSFNLLSTYDFVGSFIIVFVKVKEEIGTIESCSSNFDSSSGSHVNNDSSTLLEIA